MKENESDQIHSSPFVKCEKKLNLEDLRRGGIVQIKGEDMYSVWVKILCNNATSKQLRRIADISDTFGQGVILFSTRQIPIIPFVKLNDITDVKRLLNETELEFEACGPRIRGIDVCYAPEICGLAVTDALSLGEKLDKFFYMTDVRFKIKLSVSGCERGCTVPRVLSDVGFTGVQRDGKTGYDVYIGGRLGLKPFVGIRAAELLTEDQCVRFAQNTVELIKTEGIKGERLADIIKRKSETYVVEKLRCDLSAPGDTAAASCPTKKIAKSKGKSVLRIRALCGEVKSSQMRKIADIAERYGAGFAHFELRGSPEIPGVNDKDLPEIKKELASSSLEILDGIDNIQSCFGDYCTKTSCDAQNILKRTAAYVKEIGLVNAGIRVSGAGCANSCGIPHLSDIGFIGWVEPVINERCNGCELCISACKVNAITMINKKAVINKTGCVYCGECYRTCPFSAINEKRKGITVLAGGQGAGVRTETGAGSKTIADIALAKPVAEFLTEDEAFEVAKKLLCLIKETGKKLSDIIAEKGIEYIKGLFRKGL